jgi:hypothetical protein
MTPAADAVKFGKFAEFPAARREGHADSHLMPFGS